MGEVIGFQQQIFLPFFPVITQQQVIVLCLMLMLSAKQQQPCQVHLLLVSLKCLNFWSHTHSAATTLISAFVSHARQKPAEKTKSVVSSPRDFRRRQSPILASLFRNGVFTTHPPPMALWGVWSKSGWVSLVAVTSAPVILWGELAILEWFDTRNQKPRLLSLMGVPSQKRDKSLPPGVVSRFTWPFLLATLARTFTNEKWLKFWSSDFLKFHLHIAKQTMKSNLICRNTLREGTQFWNLVQIQGGGVWIQFQRRYPVWIWSGLKHRGGGGVWNQPQRR